MRRSASHEPQVIPTITLLLFYVVQMGLRLAVVRYEWIGRNDPSLNINPGPYDYTFRLDLYMGEWRSTGLQFKLPSDLRIASQNYHSATWMLPGRAPQRPRH